jgi:hypothetical protein
MNSALLFEAQQALSLNQRMVGELLGLSVRTVQRWYARRSSPADFQWHQLAKAVHETNPDLAARLAAEGGSTLQALGLVSASPSPPGHPSGCDLAHLADGVVCAAAESMDLPPRAVRPALLAAFRRARQMGLTLEDVEKALTPEARGKRLAKGKKGS